jgi:sterol 3beta-glucosyltransferase
MQYRFNISIVKEFEAVPCIQPGFSGLALKLHGQHDVIFEFWDKTGRDEAIERLDEVLAQTAKPHPSDPNPLPSSESHPADILAPSKKALFQTRVLPDDFLSHMPFIANRPWMSRSVALSPRTFTLLTIGSRGDVQPYIALGLRLKQDGVS